MIKKKIHFIGTLTYCSSCAFYMAVGTLFAHGIPTDCYKTEILCFEIISHVNGKKTQYLLICCINERFGLVRAGIVGAVGKTSAFRPQGAQFDSRLCRDLNICATFFPAFFPG